MPFLASWTLLTADRCNQRRRSPCPTSLARAWYCLPCARRPLSFKPKQIIKAQGRTADQAKVPSTIIDIIVSFLFGSTLGYN